MSGNSEKAAEKIRDAMEIVANLDYSEMAEAHLLPAMTQEALYVELHNALELLEGWSDE